MSQYLLDRDYSDIYFLLICRLMFRKVTWKEIFTVRETEESNRQGLWNINSEGMSHFTLRWQFIWGGFQIWNDDLKIWVSSSMKVGLADAAGVLPDSPTPFSHPSPTLEGNCRFLDSSHTYSRFPLSSALLHSRAECWAINACKVHLPKRHESSKINTPASYPTQFLRGSPGRSEPRCP